MSEELPAITSIVLSGPDNPIAPPDILGVVVRQDTNHFLGQRSVIVVFENRQFAEYVSSDLGTEIKLTNYTYPPIDKGVEFNDANITECIKKDVFDVVFKNIRKKIK